MGSCVFLRQCERAAVCDRGSWRFRDFSSRLIVIVDRGAKKATFLARFDVLLLVDDNGGVLRKSRRLMFFFKGVLYSD
ncbi:hypothetical protein EUGRSUZ_C01396 [Eucalyptus grandis]|uniref:Uncharacterized protein n=2 Tax=Eucalyptus grandis TaxID=71139 RepID=A0ACC3LD55_EUCGR|nr:hypothetical protein EUGRSUZ_C01396 [Eucalyptus grandis]